MSFTPSNRPDRPATVGDDGGSTDTTAVSPTITHYQQVSERVSAMIDEVLTVLPKLELPHPTTVKFVRANKSRPIAFLETAITAVGRRADLQAVSRLDVQAGWDTLQLHQALRPLADKLYHFAKKVDYTLDSRLALLGADALQLYYLVKGLARDPERADMLELLADLRRDLGKTAKPKRAPKPKDETAAAPATEPPATIRKKRARRKEAAVVTSL
jgi:hypothetical protein